MSGKMGLFPIAVARRIYDKCGGGSEREFAEFSRPKGSGGGSVKYAARLMGSWSANAVSCQIYTLSSATVVYKETATVYDPLSVFAALTTNDWMYCTNQAGVYYGADPGGCPGTCPLIASPPATQP